MLSRSFFHLHPDRFFEFYREFMLHPQAKPNAAHPVLAEMERAGKLTALITQNIDGLHRMAGSRAPEPTPADDRATLVLREDVSQALGALHI